MKKNRSLSSRLSSPWVYFAGVLGWTWFFWILAIVLGLSTNTAPGMLLALLGLLGPLVGGITLTYLTQGKEGRHDYWVRIFDPRRIPARWYLVIFLLVPALMGLAALLDILTGGSLVPFQEAVAPFLTRPMALIPFALSVFFLGPFPEEFGWRGYVLDRLQLRWDALKSSLILGVIWAVWHLPLFFIMGTYQYDEGAWTVWFWTFMLGIVPLTVVMTWIFNNTRRSTLAIILFHFMVVFTDDFLNTTTRTNIYSTLLLILAAALVVFVWGRTTLAGKAKAEMRIPTWLSAPGQS
jgi:membrane protease YdiL (CAAX protease family)